MDEMDRNYLEGLVMARNQGVNAERGHDIPIFGRSAADGNRCYHQGRIDEYCAQNALGQDDAPDLDLRLPVRQED